MNRLLFIDTDNTGKTRQILTQDPHNIRSAVHGYVMALFLAITILSFVLLPSLLFHRLLGSPGLAKLTPGSTALPGVPTRLGTLL